MKNTTPKTTLTQQQFHQLQPYQELLLKAANKQYITQSEKKNLIPKLKTIYQEITRTKLHNASCTSCSGNLSWIGRLGTWYNEYQSKTTKHEK